MTYASMGPAVCAFCCGLFFIFSAFAIYLLTKGCDALMSDEKVYDINTGMEIRLTDNGPKEEDDFQVKDQHRRPLIEEEIQEKIDELKLP